MLPIVVSPSSPSCRSSIAAKELLAETSSPRVTPSSCSSTPATRQRRLGLSLCVNVPPPPPVVSGPPEDAYPALEARGYQIVRFVKSSLYGCVVLASAKEQQVDTDISCGPLSPVVPVAAAPLLCVKISRLAFARQHTSPDENGRLSSVRDRVLSEASILRTSESAGVVRFVDEFATSQFHYLVTEFAGEEMFELVSSRTLSVAGAQQYAHQLVRAVSHLHSLGIAHLDLSLTNACVDESTQTLRIIDFGVADNGDLTAADQQRPHAAGGNIAMAVSPRDATPRSSTSRASPYATTASPAFSFSAMSPRVYSPVTSCSPTLPSLVRDLENVSMDQSEDRLPPAVQAPSVRRQLFFGAMAAQQSQQTMVSAVFNNTLVQSPPTITRTLGFGFESGANSAASSRHQSFSWPSGHSHLLHRMRCDVPPSKQHAQSPEQRAATAYHTSALLSSSMPPMWCPFGSDVYAVGVMLFESLRGERWNAAKFESRPEPPEHFDSTAWGLIQACTQPEATRCTIHDVALHPFFATKY